MAIVNRKYEFVFLAEPHTGSRAVREALQKLEGSVETNGDHHLDLQGCFAKGYLSEFEAETFLVFSAIRDPHDLLVSRWVYHDRQRIPFRDYLETARISEQQDSAGLTMDTLFWRTCEQVDWFIRHETLHDGLNTILDQVGAPLIDSLPIVGRTQEKPDWRQLWDEDTEQWAQLFFSDICRYDYRVKWTGSELLDAEVDKRQHVLTKPNLKD